MTQASIPILRSSSDFEKDECLKLHDYDAPKQSPKNVHHNKVKPYVGQKQKRWPKTALKKF